MSSITFCDPNAIVTTDWLEEHLEDPNLRVFDCSTQLVFEEGSGRPYRVVSGQEDHQESHVPGAGCLDLQKDFSQPDSPYAMTLASPEHVAAAFARNGIGDDTRVVLYSRRSLSWSTRFWWMLKWLGFDNAAILDGGFEKWQSEGRSLSGEPCDYPINTLSVSLRPSLFVDKGVVLNAIDDPGTCTISALGADLHSGENSRYGRPGRIPGSLNIAQISLVEPDTMVLLSSGEVFDRFASIRAKSAKRYITYCGGGIFATLDAFMLYQLGYDNVSVYDNSMSEWGPDKALPIETD